MCDIVGSELRGKLFIEHQRDASMRLTEIVIVNHSVDGEERQGMKVVCNDDGTIRGGVDLIEGVDIVGHAEMK